MMPDKNPCEMEENDMNQPTGKENTAPEFIPPVNVTDAKFIELAKKMKKLSQETLQMIQRDLEPDDRKYEDEKEKAEDKTETPTAEVKVVKVDTPKDATALLTSLKKIVLGFPTTSDQ